MVSKATFLPATSSLYQYGFSQLPQTRKTDDIENKNIKLNYVIHKIIILSRDYVNILDMLRLIESIFSIPRSSERFLFNPWKLGPQLICSCSGECHFSLRGG